MKQESSDDMEIVLSTSSGLMMLCNMMCNVAVRSQSPGQPVVLEKPLHISGSQRFKRSLLFSFICEDKMAFTTQYTQQESYC